MRWTCSISSSEDFSTALEQVCESLRSRLDGARPDLVIAFVSPGHSEHYVRVHRELASRLQTEAILGCSGAGVLADGLELERRPGLAVAAAHLPDVRTQVFHLEPDALAGVDRSQSKWEPQLGRDLSQATSMILLADPFSVDTGAVLRDLDQRFPGITKVGGLASGGAQPGQSVLYAGDRVHGSGLVGVTFAGDLRMQAVVSQGCRPIGAPMFVTRADGHVIDELDGRRPAPVLQELFESLPPTDQSAMRHSLFLGLTMSPQREVYGQGDFLIRNIVGLDARTGSMAVGTTVARNAVVQFHLRDAQTASDDLHRLLGAELARPRGALLFSCLGRGKGLYGEPDHESRLFAERVGPVPLAGFFCAGEIGPVQGRTWLHGYTSAFALFSTDDG